MPEPDWNIVEHRGLEGLESLEADWRRLYAALDDHADFHTFEAMHAYVAHLADDPGRFRCLVLREGDEARAICPLEEKRQRILGIPVRALALPSSPLRGITDVVCPPGEAADRLVPALVAHLKGVPGRRASSAPGPPAGVIRRRGQGASRSQARTTAPV